MIKIFNDNPEMSKSLFDTQTEKLGLLENYKESKGQAVIKFTGLRDLREGMGYKYSVHRKLFFQQCGEHTEQEFYAELG